MWAWGGERGVGWNGERHVGVGWNRDRGIGVLWDGERDVGVLLNGEVGWNGGRGVKLNGDEVWV